MQFLAELENSELFETNFFFEKKLPSFLHLTLVIFQKIFKKKLQLSKEKSKGIFF